jgi:hypothetical protein
MLRGCINLCDELRKIEKAHFGVFFYSIRNFVSYRAKTLRGIALRRQGNQSQATPPQAVHFAMQNAFLEEQHLKLFTFVFSL